MSKELCKCGHDKDCHCFGIKCCCGGCTSCVDCDKFTPKRRSYTIEEVENKRKQLTHMANNFSKLLEASKNLVWGQNRFVKKYWDCLESAIKKAEGGGQP